MPRQNVGGEGVPTKVVSFSLPAPVLEKVDALAKAKDMKRAEWLRELVRVAVG